MTKYTLEKKLKELRIYWHKIIEDQWGDMIIEIPKYYYFFKVMKLKKVIKNVLLVEIKIIRV